VIESVGKTKETKYIFPELRSVDISTLLRELKEEGKIMHVGSKRFGRALVFGLNYN